MVTGNGSGLTGNESYPGLVVGSKARESKDCPSNSRNLRVQYFPGMTRSVTLVPESLAGLSISSLKLRRFLAQCNNLCGVF